MLESHVVVHWRGQPLPVILHVGDPCYLPISEILDRYAEWGCLDRNELTGYWCPMLEFVKESEHPSVEIAKQHLKSHPSEDSFSVGIFE